MFLTFLGKKLNKLGCLELENEYLQVLISSLNYILVVNKNRT